MSLDPALYNFSATDQSAYIRFYPHTQTGPINALWDVSYTDSSASEWSYNSNFGQGSSSHVTTLAGAYILINWAGTAVWLYGTASSGAYTVQIDQGALITGSGAEDSVLFSQTGLDYGPHLLNMTVLGGQVSFASATITAGMGDIGTTLSSKTITTVLNETTPNSLNPFFTADDTWSIANLYANQSEPYPCITTSTLDSALSFDLTSTVGFALYGSDDWTQGLFTVSVSASSGLYYSEWTIPDNLIQYNPHSFWTAVNQFKYLVTGLNSSDTYHVEIQNLGANFNLASLVTYVAMPNSPGSSTTTGTRIGTLSTATAPKGDTSSTATAPSKGDTLSTTTANTGDTPSPATATSGNMSPTSSPTPAISSVVNNSRAYTTIIPAVVGSIGGVVLLILGMYIVVKRISRRRRQRDLNYMTAAALSAEYLISPTQAFAPISQPSTSMAATSVPVSVYRTSYSSSNGFLRD